MPTECQRVFPGSEVRRTGPGIAPIWHYHSEIELNLVIAGRGAYFLDNAHFDLSPGSLVWMLPNQSHRLLPGPDLQMWVLTHASKGLNRSWLDAVASHANRVLAREDAIALDRLFVHVSQDSDEPETYCAGLDYALRSALHISASGPEAAQAPLHPAVLSALRFLRDTPDVPSAAALAERCGVSPVYLRELLAEQTNCGFVEWRNRFRLERFQLLYPESGDLLTAALEAGFGSYNQFHRVFLDIVGTTPGDWVKGGLDPRSSPPIADFARAPDRAGSRMIWYALANLIFEDARRWIRPGFAERIAANREPDGPVRAISSHVVASYDQHRFEADLLREVEGRDAESARRLRVLLSRFDVFEAAADALSLWGYDLADLASIIGCHIMSVSLFVHEQPRPNRPAVRAFISRVAVALEESGSYQDAATEDRQRAAAALSVQFFLLRSAAIAAINTGRPELVSAMRHAARRTMVETYGLDFKPDLLST